MNTPNKNAINNALGFLSLGFKFLRLTENVLTETIKQGNKHMIVQSGKSHATTPAEYNWEEYFDNTKWSDFSILVPILFNYYHGLELVMKGVISCTEEIEPKHGLTDLLTRVTNIANVPQEMKNLLLAHIDDAKINNAISDLLRKNNLSINELYVLLRYPIDKKQAVQFNYLDLHYQEDRLLPYFIQLVEDSKNIRKVVGNYFNKYKQ